MTRIVVATCLAFAAGAVSHELLAQPPKKAYMLVQVDVTNPAQYGEYTKLSPGIIAKYGGKFLARGGRTSTLEGTAARARVAVVEFPSFERIAEFYRSAEYTAARKVRDGAGNVQLVAVEGVE